MLLLSCQQIEKSYNHNPVLKGISFDIATEDRVALIGDNGSGKTTLAEIIAGEKTPDKGRVLFHGKNPSIGYLTQGREKLISDEELHPGFLASSKQMGLKKVHHWEQERLENASGGEKTKLALARIWNRNPDLLILDEPTNHLDEKGIEWLIDHLTGFPGALLVIAHDRYFLDKVTQTTLELKDGSLTLFPGNYSFYRNEKSHREKTQRRIYEEENRERKKLKQEITRTKNWAQSGHQKSRQKARELGNKKGGKEYFRARAAKKERQAQSKIKQLEKKTRSATPPPPKKPRLNVDLREPEKRGRRILEMTNGSLAFGQRILFSESSFYLLRGEKTTLRGPNGCGKTSLLRAITGEKELHQGDLWLSPSVTIGYLPQEEKIPAPRQTGKNVLAPFSREKREWVMTILARLGFPAKLLTRPLCNLSYGERSRFDICHLLLKEPDLLILDEPTTHLDLNLRVGLEEALQNFQGTLVLVCHDRYLVNSLCSTQLVFEEGVVRKKPLPIKKDAPPKEGDLMVIETRIAGILGELGQHSPDSMEYRELEQKLGELTKARQKIKAGQNPDLKG